MLINLVVWISRYYYMKTIDPKGDNTKRQIPKNSYILRLKIHVQLLLGPNCRKAVGWGCRFV
jgi:hypothetical protein